MKFVDQMIKVQTWASQFQGETASDGNLIDCKKSFEIFIGDHFLTPYDDIQKFWVTCDRQMNPDVDGFLIVDVTAIMVDGDEPDAVRFQIQDNQTLANWSPRVVEPVTILGTDDRLNAIDAYDRAMGCV